MPLDASYVQQDASYQQQDAASYQQQDAFASSEPVAYAQQDAFSMAPAEAAYAPQQDAFAMEAPAYTAPAPPPPVPTGPSPLQCVTPSFPPLSCHLIDFSIGALREKIDDCGADCYQHEAFLHCLGKEVCCVLGLTWLASDRI